MAYMEQLVLGTWKLESFELKDLSGVRKPWGREIHGLLIYAPTRHMSVSINKAVENDATQTEAENLFDSILFYTGTYQVEGTVIRHQVTEASNPARIGKEMIRHAELNGDLLTLTTPQESFGRAILVWKKIG
jgi:hypothetical protein